jgi:hypothetical protein
VPAAVVAGVEAVQRLTMLGFRSLKYPATPDPSAPDYHAQCMRYWAESRVWWDNWAANYACCMVLLLAAFLAAIAAAVVIDLT